MFSVFFNYSDAGDKRMKTVLTIAGSDCSGGAGIQADLKTITVHGLYGMSVITSLTAQNTVGVFGIKDVPSEFIAKQIDCIFQDIVPDAVKIGMVSQKETIEIIVEKLTQYQAKNIVVDPVMVSTSGVSLCTMEAKQLLLTRLLQIATLITPNLLEAEVLSGIKITSRMDMEQAAQEIARKSKSAVLIKGGHRQKDASDFCYIAGEKKWFLQERIDNQNTHGTGCTLSSAIACQLALGKSVQNSIALAKNYVTEALKAGLDLGKGAGPLQHNINFSRNLKKDC